MNGVIDLGGAKVLYCTCGDQPHMVFRGDEYYVRCVSCQSTSHAADSMIGAAEIWNEDQDEIDGPTRRQG